MESSTLARKGKKSLNRMRTLVDELEVQFALGKAEARDAFKREQKNLSVYLQKQKEAVTKSESMRENHLQEMVMAFEKLEGNLHIEVPNGKRAYDKYKKEVMASINQLEHVLSEYAEEFANYMEGHLTQFKSLLDAYRIQLALSDNETVDRPEQRKAELQEKVAEIRTLLLTEEKDDDKIDNFVKEVSNSFDHLKKAFSDLLG